MANSNPIKKIEKDVAYLKTRVDEHIGDIGEDAHGLPENGNAGMIPYEVYQKVLHQFKERKYVNGVDITTLDPDLYCGSNLTGIPANAVDSAEKDALALIDVSSYRDGKKQIIYRQSWSGATWIKNIHVPGSVQDSIGWQKFSTHAILWEGSASKVGTTIKLAEPKNNFTELLVMYEGPASNMGSAFVSTSRDHYSFDVTNVPDDMSADAVAYFPEARLEFGTSQTDCKLTVNQPIVIKGTANYDTSGSNLITITKIIGFNL